MGFKFQGPGPNFNSATLLTSYVGTQVFSVSVCSSELGGLNKMAKEKSPL